MITINLTPIEELENRFWWIPDACVLALMSALALGSVYFYIHTIQSEIGVFQADKDRLIEETNILGPEVEKFNSLNTKIAALDTKKMALQRITESKLVRYLPIILLENIQNLKPEGVWLNSLVFLDKKPANGEQAPPPPPPPAPDGTPAAAAVDPSKSLFNDFQGKDFPITIEISGGALNNILIADFMMALKATQNQSFEKSDLRSQLFFSDVGINFSQISTDTAAAPAGGEAAQNAKPSTVSFKLELTFRERAPGTPDANSKFSSFIDTFKRDGQATMN